jgi:beta-fructofuranosidase
MVLPANQEIILSGVGGNAMELQVEIDPRNSPMVELNVLRSPAKEEFTRILLFKNRDVTSRFTPPQQKLSVVTVDGTRASQLPDVLSRPPETASLMIPPDEFFKLRVFVDRGIIEVFINGRQCIAMRVHPGRTDSVGISLMSQGQNAELKALTAWPMKAIFPE